MYDVCIIGAGVVGCAIALQDIAQRGTGSSILPERVKRSIFMKIKDLKKFN